MELVIDGNRGIYAPQAFCNIIFGGFKEIPPAVHGDDIRIVKEGPEHEDYWDAWERIMDNYEDENGNIIYQNQDIWLCQPGEIQQLSYE